MPEEGRNILKYSPGDKSLKAPFIIYADLECLLKKEQSCENSPKNSYTQRKAKHKPSGYSLSLICSFDDTKHRRKFYRRKDCIDKICEHLKELATEIINYKEKEMIPLTYNKIKSYEKQKACHIYARKGFVMMKIRKANITFIIKSEIIVTKPENLEELLIIFAT